MELVNDLEVVRARRIDAGLPPSSPEESSDTKDRTIEEVSDKEQAPALVAGYIMA